MAEDNQHRYQAPAWWKFQTACLACGLHRTADVHFVSIKTLLQEVRSAAWYGSFGERKTLTLDQVTSSIQKLVSDHGARAEWLRNRDHTYLAPSYDDLIFNLRTNWRMILPLEIDFSDCDDRMNWFHAWCTLVKITSVADVYDYSNLAHAYNLIVLDDLSVRAYDPGTGMFIRIGNQGPKFEFRDIVLHV